MNYGEAKAVLSKIPTCDEEDGSSDIESRQQHDREEQARNIIILSLSENAERTANALTRIADAIERAD